MQTKTKQATVRMVGCAYGEISAVIEKVKRL